ncbi:NADPH-dependent FMN reductase [Streptomyces sp. NPDC059740]|uniref:NADPH-dependent FMN reductase n=1 Tax=Streptomyces sp. NPDC059740 TaxID=3346926 RepID=UPI0036665F9C
MATVLALSGSPSPTSRTAALVGHVSARLRDVGHEVRHLALRELPPGPLLAADTSHPAIWEAVEAVTAADALVVGTPVYKAAYSGLLKSFLDLLPQTALAGRTVLPLATGGTPAHVLVLDYALRPVLTSLGTDAVLRGWFVLDRDVTRTPEGSTLLSPEADRGVGAAVDRLTAALRDTDSPAAVRLAAV